MIRPTRQFVATAVWLTIAAATLISEDTAFAKTNDAPSKGTAEACAVAKNRAAQKRIRARLACLEQAHLDPSQLDPRCVAMADAKFTVAIAKADFNGGCIYTDDADAIAGQVDDCADAIAALTPPAPVCGDGVVSAGEECDPFAFPNGCADNLGCQADCTCGAVCGDGIVSPGEACDPFAAGSGCTAGTVCSSDCSACVVPPAGFCVPMATGACNTGLEGCAQSCDGGDLASSCVSTTDGVLTCVEQLCTLRTCNATSDCDAGEVCFTEGCCGQPLAGTATATTSNAWR